MSIEVNPQSVLSMKTQMESSIQQIAKQSYVEAKSSRLFKNPFVGMRLFVLAKLLGIKDYNNLSSEGLVEEIRLKIAQSFSLKQLAIVGLIVTDTVQYELMKKMPLLVPDTLVHFLVNKILTPLVDKLISRTYKVDTRDVVLEAFYIAAVSNVYLDLKSTKYEFENLSEQEKIKYVKFVVKNAFMLGSSYDLSQSIADKIGVGKSYNNFRSFYMIYKFSRFYKQYKFEITSARFVNLFTERIKVAVMRILGKFTGNKYYWVIRGLFDVILGPLMIAVLLDFGEVSKRMADSYRGSEQNLLKGIEL